MPGKLPFKLIIFDWDGTLMDSSAYIVTCMQKAAKDAQVTVPSAEAIRASIGLSGLALMRHLFPDMDEKQALSVIQRYRTHFYLPQEAQTHLFPGAKNVLANLSEQGYLLAIATAKSKRGLRDDLQQTELTSLIDATCTAEESASKPNPLMLFDILKQLNVSAKDALMVGDTTFDLEMAQQARVSALAVSYGSHSAAQLMALQPLACIHKISELTAWLAAFAVQHTEET